MMMPVTSSASDPLSKRRLLIVGGSGRTGRLIIDEALRRGHPVTALVRNPAAIPDQNGLTLIEGSPLNKADIERAFAATPDDPPIVVISALGQTRKTGNPWAAPTSPRHLMADSMANVVDVIKTRQQQHEASRNVKIVAISMFGVGTSFANLNFTMRFVMTWSNMWQTLEDQNLVDEQLKKSGVDFVLVRPCMLKGEVAAPVKVLGDEGAVAGFMPSVSVGTVAGFVLDAAEGTEWDGRTPVISN